MCCLHRRSQSPALIQFGGCPSRLGLLRGGLRLSVPFKWILLASGPLLCGIIYLGMADKIGVSVSDDSVSEHEELVSLSSIKSFGGGVAVFLDDEDSEKGLGSPWKGRSIFL